MVPTRNATPPNDSRAAHSEEFRLNSFFAGIGGFDLAFERAGIAPVYHCEKDQFCQSVLKRHWPSLIMEADVANIRLEALPEATVWCGGFPCQDVSVARGSLARAGLNGRRSGLFYNFFDLISAKLPRVVLIENVTGLLSSHQGRDFDAILKLLTGIGYGVAWRVLNSRYFGAPQSRSRVFICAWYGSVQNAASALFESLPGYQAEDERQGFLTPSERGGMTVPEVAYCLAATSGRHTGTDWSRSYVAYEDRVRRLTPSECEGLQGFPKSWTVPQAEFEQPASDINTLRYHALGNAVCVPVVEWIARRIAKILKQEGTPKFANMKRFATCSCEALAELVSTQRGVQPTILLLDDPQQLLWQSEPVYKWRSGGCAVGGTAATAPVLSGPATPVFSKFIDVVETNEVDDRYFLSPNAAEGILRRVHGQGRTLFAPLAKSLAKLAKKDDRSLAVRSRLELVDSNA